MRRAPIALLLAALSAAAQPEGPADENPPLSNPAGRAEWADPRLALEQSRADEHSILSDLDQIDRQLQVVRDEVEALQTRAETLDASRKDHARALARAQADLDLHRKRVAALVSALYEIEREGLARVIFDAHDPSDLRRRAAYLEVVIKKAKRRIESFQDQVKRKKQALSQVEADAEALASLKSDLEAKVTDLERQQAQRRALLREVRSRRALALQALSEMSAASRNLGSRLAMTAGAEYASPPASYPASSAPERTAPQTFRSAQGQLPWPVQGRLLRRFGPYIDPASSQPADSKGIDIAAPIGTPFHAVWSGAVKIAGFVPGYGLTVALDHGAYTTVYAHAGKLEVRRGQWVQAGDVLGVVGNTGLTDGADYQLTFEIRYNGTPQDPLPWLAPRSLPPPGTPKEPWNPQAAGSPASR